MNIIALRGKSKMKSEPIKINLFDKRGASSFPLTFFSSSANMIINWHINAFLFVLRLLLIQAQSFDSQELKDETIILRDFSLPTNCDPVSLPLLSVAIISQPDTANISSRLYLKRKLDKSNYYYRAVFEPCEECTKSNSLQGEGDHVFAIQRVGNETNHISVIHQSSEGALCLSYETSTGLFFLPCNNVERDVYIFRKVAYNIHPLLNPDISILSIALNATTKDMYINIIADESTCKASRNNDECAAKDPAKPLFKDGQCVARAESDCPAHQVLENGTCRDRTQNDCKDHKKLKDGKCSECEDLFVMDGNNCVPGCPDGQFLIYDQTGAHPQSCSDGTTGLFKLKLSDDSVVNNFLATHWGVAWNWNSLSKDSPFNDAWKFKISPNHGLNTEFGTMISVRHEVYTTNRAERCWTIKDWGDQGKQILLNTNDHGRTIRFYAKDGNVDLDCATNGPEGVLKYGYGDDCKNQAWFTFKLVAA